MSMPYCAVSYWPLELNEWRICSVDKRERYMQVLFCILAISVLVKAKRKLSPCFVPCPLSKVSLRHLVQMRATG